MSKNQRGESAILDDFYTNRVLSQRLLKDVERVTGRSLESWKSIVEPSAGSGAFFDYLPLNSRKGYDIAPQSVNVQVADFLALGDHAFPEQREDTIVVGNPPFGKKGSIALRFLNACLKNAAYVAFILPRSFEKISFLTRVQPLTAQILHQEVLPKNSFERKGKIVDVPTVFMIWSVQPNVPPRCYTMIHITDDFVFVKNPTNADLESGDLIMIQRTGNAAGRITKSVDKMRTKTQSVSFYFLRSLKGKEVFDRLERLNLENGNSKQRTAGMPSISKTEIIQAYMLGIDK